MKKQAQFLTAILESGITSKAITRAVAQMVGCKVVGSYNI